MHPKMSQICDYELNDVKQLLDLECKVLASMQFCDLSIALMIHVPNLLQKPVRYILLWMS